MAYITGQRRIPAEWLINLLLSSIPRSITAWSGLYDPVAGGIARNAPSHMKATFFGYLPHSPTLLCPPAPGTKYLNEVFVVTREVKDKITDEIVTMADYSELGLLLITVLPITLVVPVWPLCSFSSRFRTND